MSGRLSTTALLRRPNPNWRLHVALHPLPITDSRSETVKTRSDGVLVLCKQTCHCATIHQEKGCLACMQAFLLSSHEIVTVVSTG